jgi:hypothetical protein
MALTQFNEWEPQLDPVNGRQAQEPRVFAHDAVPVVIGAINDSDANHGIRITNAGSSYTVGDEITLTTNGAATVAAVVVVDAISGTPGSGAVTDYHIKSTNLGEGYTLTGAGSIQDDSGAGAFACVITNIDIPNTQKRGACLYVGAAIASLVVVMESGSEATFKSVSAGSILPLLVKRAVSGFSGTNDVIALY